jgi:uncharacterized protein YbbC (DUF1343 family)
LKVRSLKLGEICVYLRKSVKSVVKNKKANYLLLSILSGIMIFMPCFNFAQIKTGAERTDLYFGLLKNKTIAIVANNASLISNKNIVDSLVSSGFDVKIIFSPEHGFRKFEEAGQVIKNSIDSVTGIRIISLYGKNKKPDLKELKKIDVVVFDLQDVGVRFFTYISTLTNIMEACAESNTPLIVLDRPDPNGFYVDGPVLDSGYASFVGMHPVPVVYGMTIGEYAGMVNEEGWLKNGVICDLQVIPLENYFHSSLYQLPVKPSPGLTTMNAVYLYPSLCLFEGTIVSVGRGTDTPFEVFGHPVMKGFSYSFTPESKKEMTQNPPYKGQLCLGLNLRDFYSAHPKMKGRINLSWLIMAFKDLGSKPEFFNDYFDKLAGNSELRKQITDGLSEMEIRKSWQTGLLKFKEIRQRHLLYPE